MVIDNELKKKNEHLRNKIEKIKLVKIFIDVESIRESNK